MSHLKVNPRYGHNVTRLAALHFTHNNSLQTAILPRTFLSCVAHAGMLRLLTHSSVTDKTITTYLSSSNQRTNNITTISRKLFEHDCELYDAQYL